MFASVRCYFVHRLPTMELVQRVAEDFAVQIAARAGFVSYEFIDGGGGDAVSISVFRDAAHAQASRDLARRWTEQRLQDLELTITESLHGKIVISRAARGIATLAPEGHVGHYVRLRRYRVAAADVDRLLRRVDASFVDRVAAVDGFLGYRLIDCGSGESLSSSLFQDGTSAAALDELGRDSSAKRLATSELDRTDIVGGGPVVVSRVTDALLARVEI